MKRLFLLVALATLPMKALAQDAPNNAPKDAASVAYDITVNADPTKSNGNPWDGVPGLRNSKLNINSAPDIAVCIVQAESKPNCLWKPDGRRLFSICQNQYTCKFDNVALSAPIGLIFIDVDIRNHDIIDTLILTGNEPKSADDEISDSLRGAMSMLTPNRSEDFKEHVVKNAKLVPLADCIGKPCRLTQSSFQLQPHN
jgi:hypothetical protein